MFKMKILFLVYHGFSEESGISKKIHYQVKGLRQNGHEVHLCYYDFDSRGHRCRYVDDNVIADYGLGAMAALRSRIDLGCICRYCVDNGIEMVYARSFMNASPVLVGLFRRALAAKMEAIVTFSNKKSIFGKRTICISNGIDLDSIPLHNPKKQQDIHLIAVAEIHYWHGFDRLVAGLGEYYKSNLNGRKVYFHVVGWEDDRGTTSNGYLTVEQMARKYGIEKYVIKHGKLFGDKLDEVFNQCVFAIGSLGRHRSGITEIKTLKNREYAARGISFIYSENDSDFDDKPYIIKAPADESPINVGEIINYIDSHDFNPAEIRTTVEHLSWKYQMEKVITEI